jgi:sugar phosphate isomerase/epimerase
MIRFGGPVFLSGKVPADDYAAIARAHRAKGFTAAYAPGISLKDSAKIKAAREAFAAAGVMIAEVGYWDNLVDADADTRRQNRQRMVDALALAEALGARCAVDIFGSYCHGGGSTRHVARNFSKAAFDEAVEMARYFIDQVKPKRTCFTYEIFPFDVVDSPAMIAKLIRAVDRRQFGVHLDLVNLINCPRAYFASGAIMRRCIKLFGDRIVAAHAKDIKLREPAISVILEEVVAGQGNLDFATCLRELYRLPQAVPYMMEHLGTEAEYDQAAAHIRQVAKAEGIEL